MRKKNISFEGKLHIAAVLVLALSSCMTWMGYGQDIEFHAQRLAAIAEEMRHGVGIYRIYTTVCEGYGYASPLFYGDIFLYPAALLTRLGIPLAVTFRLFLASIMLLSYGIAYFCGTSVWGRERGMTAAYLYAFSPVLLEDIFIRYAVGEALGYAFLPLVLLGFYRIVAEPKDKKRDYRLLAYGMSGMIVSHVITTVLTVILLVLLALLSIKRIWENKKILLQFVKAAFLTVGLTAYFTLPMLEQMVTSQFFVTDRQTSNLAGNVAPLAGLLFGSEYLSVLNVVIGKLTGKEDFFTFSWFPGAFGYLLFFLLFIFLKKREMGKAKSVRFSFGMACLYLAISVVPFIQPLLEPFVGFIKIPWRNLTFYMCFLVICAVIVLDKIKAEQEKLYRLGMLAAVFGTIVAFGGLTVITAHNGVFPFESLSTTSIGLGEYLPAAVPHYDYSLERGDEVACSGESSYTFIRHAGYAELSFSGASAPATFEVPIYMYRGYAVENEETGALYEPAVSQNGLIEFTVPEKAAAVKIYYRGTLLQSIAELVTLLTLLLLYCGRLNMKKRTSKV